MAEPSFATLKGELEQAYVPLRHFTLGHSGCTQRAGLAAMQRVTELCDQLAAAFSTGPNAARAAAAVNCGRTRVVAAQYRMNLLRAKHPGRKPAATS